MSRIPGIRRLVRLATGRSTVDADIDDELAFHFAATVDELVQRGMTPDAARREAERRFGDVRATRARLRAIDGSARRRLLARERLGAFALDLRMAARGLRRAPALALAIVLTLALGIGANATMFGIVDRLLLRPPAHVVEPGRAGRLWVTRPIEGEGDFTGSGFGYATFDVLRRRTTAFSQLAAISDNEHTVGRGLAARPMRVSEVTGEYFPLMGVRPLVGRLLGPADDQDGAPPAAVISWDTWQRDFGGTAAAIGAPLVVNGRTFTVVGVTPRGFSGPALESIGAWLTMAQADYARRFTPDWRTNFDWVWLSVVGRLKPGVSPERANAELTTAYRAAMAGGEQSPERQRSFRDARVAMHDLIAARGPDGTQEGRVALWLAGVAAIVLLVACANVANLLLARALQREREVAVQLALGVAPSRLVRQFLAESALLALGGGAAALLVATLGGRALATVLLPDVAWDGGPVDGRVLAATVAVIGATTLLITLSPALQARRVSVHDALRAGGRGSTGRLSRLRATLTVAQAALSVLLLVGAGLFVRSLQRAHGAELGMDARRVIYSAVELGNVGYDRARVQAFWRQAHERALALPGVATASLSATAPYRSQWNQSLYDVRGDTLRTGTGGTPSLNPVGPEYLRTVGTPLRRGRHFTAADASGSAPVVIVNESMARAAWPGTDAMGKCFRAGADTSPCMEIVGIAANARDNDLGSAMSPQYYVPLAQVPPTRRLHLFVRAAAADARPLKTEVRRMLQSLDPDAPYPVVESIEEILAPQYRPWRLGAALFSAFGVLALAVAAVGLYGVLAYDVAQRTRELGVRAALGARRGDVIRLVMRRGLVVAGTGVALGVAASLVAVRWIGDLLFQTSPRDPLTFAAVAATLLVVATLASLLPAWRATRVSPQAALRAE